jgi:hypothetical protein
MKINRRIFYALSVEIPGMEYTNLILSVPVQVVDQIVLGGFADADTE